MLNVCIFEQVKTWHTERNVVLTTLNVCIFEQVKTWHTERNVVLALGMALSHQNLNTNKKGYVAW
jgi:hypothetical protein